MTLNTENAYRNKIIDELVNEWDMTEARAIELVEKRDAIINHCILMGSYTYYAVMQIIQAENEGWPLEKEYS